MSNGFLCVFEGIDNSGKTTVIEAVTESLQGNEFPVTTTSEPSDHWTGKAVRRAIHSDTAEDPITAFFLFMADRNKHIKETIQPAVESGDIVLSDRFADSTRVYQPRSTQFDNAEEWIESVMGPWTMEPDLTIYLDIPVEESLRRGGGDDVYETEEFLTDVRAAYERLVDKSDSTIRVDATQPVEDVVTECVSIIVQHRFMVLLGVE